MEKLTRLKNKLLIGMVSYLSSSSSKNVLKIAKNAFTTYGKMTGKHQNKDQKKSNL